MRDGNATPPACGASVDTAVQGAAAASRDADVKKTDGRRDAAGPDAEVKFLVAARDPRYYSTAFTISSTTFFASPNTIIVLSM